MQMPDVKQDNVLPLYWLQAFRVPLPYVLAALLYMGILAWFPQIDLAVSRLFYDTETSTFLLANRFWVKSIAWIVGIGSLGFVCLCVLLYLTNRFTGKRYFYMNGRLAVYFVLVFAIGPALVVNYGFKDHWGRARPRDTVEFGGTKEFTPYYVPADQCESDCSFMSGHTARSFYFISIVFAVWHLALSARLRYALLFLALSYGSVAALMRIMEGRHFLSDVSASALTVTYIAWVLFRLLHPKMENAT